MFSEATNLASAWACVVKVNWIVSFKIDPVAIRKTATRKGDSVRPFVVDNRELQIAVERCSVYQLPFHDGS